MKYHLAPAVSVGTAETADLVVSVEKADSVVLKIGPWPFLQQPVEPVGGELGVRGVGVCRPHLFFLYPRPPPP